MLHGTLWDKIPRFAVPVAATALLMLAAVLYFRPSRRYAHLQKSDGAASAKIEG